MAEILRNSFPRSLIVYKWQQESFLSAQRQPGGVHLLEYVLMGRKRSHGMIKER